MITEFLRKVERQQSAFVVTFALVATCGLLAWPTLFAPQSAMAEIDIGHYTQAEQSQPELISQYLFVRRRSDPTATALAIIQSAEFTHRVSRRCGVPASAFELRAEPSRPSGRVLIHTRSRCAYSAKRLADEAAMEYVRLSRGAYLPYLKYLEKMAASSRARLVALRRTSLTRPVHPRLLKQVQNYWVAYTTKLAQLRSGRALVSERVPRVVSWSSAQGTLDGRIGITGWLLVAGVAALAVVTLRDRRQ